MSDIPRRLCGGAGRKVLEVLADTPDGLSTQKLMQVAYVSRAHLARVLGAGRAAGYLWSEPDDRELGQLGGTPLRWGRTPKPLPDPMPVYRPGRPSAVPLSATG